MSVEPEVITYADVRDSIAIARSHGEKFFEQIVWQVEHEVWHVLGYASWDALREVEYKDLGVTAPRADRPELVARLRVRGLTQQQIADTIGVSQKTVSNTLRPLISTSTNEDEPPVVVTNSRGQQRPASYAPRAPEPTDDLPPFNPATGEVLDAAPPARPAKAKPNNDAGLINDIRLYLRALGSSPEVARLSPAGKQHIIDALNATIDQIGS